MVLYLTWKAWYRRESGSASYRAGMSFCRYCRQKKKRELNTGTGRKWGKLKACSVFLEYILWGKYAVTIKQIIFKSIVVCYEHLKWRVPCFFNRRDVYLQFSTCPIPFLWTNSPWAFLPCPSSSVHLVPFPELRIRLCVRSPNPAITKILGPKIFWHSQILYVRAERALGWQLLLLMRPFVYLREQDVEYPAGHRKW